MISSLRYTFFFGIMFLFGCNNKKQELVDANNDSIVKYLKLASNDSLSFPERDKWNEKAFSLIDLDRNDTVVRYFLSKSSYNFIPTKNWKKYKETAKIHYIKSLEEKDTLNLARYFRFKAGFYRNNRIYDSAFYFYIKAEKMYKETKEENDLANVYINKGFVQYKQDDYLGAELSLNKAYKLLKKRKANRSTYDALTLLGNIAHNLKNYGTAVKFHKEALNLAIQLKLSPRIYRFNFVETSLNNIGNSYKDQKEYRKALYYFEKALVSNNIVKEDILIYPYLYTNLGYCKMQLHQYHELPKLFKKASKIFDSLGVKNECALTNVYLSDYYFRDNDTVNAVKYSEMALKLAKEAKAPYYYLIALSNAGHINKDKASKYIQQYHQLNDSLQFEERKARSQFFKIQLETDEIEQEKEKAIKQKWVIVSIISGVLLIVILLFVIYRQRARQKELKLLQIQQKANEDIYQLMLSQNAKIEEARQIEKKRIALELHDGIMNRLVSTRMNLFVLSRKNDQKTINDCLSYIEDIHKIENEIRNVSHQLNQDVFVEKDSFKMLLEQFVDEQNKHLKINYELQIAEQVNWDMISSQIKMHLYRILQEATNNINKHAKATNMIISFSMDEKHLNMTISDNGIGFDLGKTKEGIGLKNMEQRVLSLKGVFTIQSKANKGTVLHLSIPAK